MQKRVMGRPLLLEQVAQVTSEHAMISKLKVERNINPHHFGKNVSLIVATR